MLHLPVIWQQEILKILWKDLSFLPTDLSIAQSLQALKFPLKYGA